MSNPSAKPCKSSIKHEKWLSENKAAKKQLQQGIADAKRNKLYYLGDFSKYINTQHKTK